MSLILLPNEILAIILSYNHEALLEYMTQEYNWKYIYQILFGNYEANAFNKCPQYVGDEHLNALIIRLFCSIKDVICGYNFTIIVRSDKSAWGTGNNSKGQLGGGEHTKKLNNFTRLPVDNIKQIACGSSHTLILKYDGTLLGSGTNHFGQLGLDATMVDCIYSFVQIPIDNVKSITCGYHFSIVQKYDETVWVSGLNSDGQLGLPHHHNSNSFVQISLKNVKTVECFNLHTCILKPGKLIAMGRNTNKVFGSNINDTDTFTAEGLMDDIDKVYCGANNTLVQKVDKSIWSCNIILKRTSVVDEIKFTRIPIDDVETVYCLDLTNVFIKSDKSVWFENSYGEIVQLEINNVKKLVHGTNHIILLKTNNSLLTMETDSDIFEMQQQLHFPWKAPFSEIPLFHYANLY